MNTRLLGTFALATSPLMMIGGLLFNMLERDPRAEVLGFFFVLGWMCSLAGLWALRATGNGWGGRLVLLMEGLFLVFALGNQIYGVAGAADESNVLFVITDVAWPLSVSFMMVVGIAAIRAKVLPGWQRFAPLFCGLAFPLLVATGLLFGMAVGGQIFATYILFAWGALAYAVRSAEAPIAGELAASVS